MNYTIWRVYSGGTGIFNDFQWSNRRRLKNSRLCPGPGKSFRLGRFLREPRRPVFGLHRLFGRGPAQSGHVSGLLYADGSGGVRLAKWFPEQTLDLRQ
jgi:hypothetical protein